MQGQRTHNVELRDRRGRQIGQLKVRPDFDGNEEEYRRGTDNFQGNPQQYHDNNGVQDDDYNERGLFGNKKQQFNRPPSKPGFQGPGQQPGQKDSNLDNILFGVGGAVAAVGAGLVGYGIYEHVKENKQKQGDHGGHGQHGQQQQEGKHQGQGYVHEVGSNQGYGSGNQGHGGSNYGGSSGQGQGGAGGYGSGGGYGGNSGGYGNSSGGYGKSNNY